MTMTLFEKLKEEGQQKLLIKVLERKFGSLTAELKQRVSAMSEEELVNTLVAVESAKSLEDLGLGQR